MKTIQYSVQIVQPSRSMNEIIPAVYVFYMLTLSFYSFGLVAAERSEEMVR